MSDNPMAPDWWLASDGKWYPPQSRPGGAPPVVDQGPADSPPSPDWWLASDGKWYPPSLSGGGGYHGYQQPVAVSPMLSGWLQGLLYGSAALAALTAVFNFGALSAFEAYQDEGFARLSNWIDAHDRAMGSSALFFLLYLATGILMIIWSFKASQTIDRLGPHRRTWSPGWAIGGWFIPLANMIIPKLVLNEVERAATAPRSGTQVVGEWRRQGTSALGWVWWIIYIAASVFLAVGFAFTGDPDVALVRHDPGDVRSAYVFQAFAMAAFAVSGVLGALFVRKLSSFLSPASLDPSEAYWR